MDSKINSINQYITDHNRIIELMPLDEIAEAMAVLREARMSGRKVFTMGNGGSASTASHFVCDLAKNTRQEGLPSFRVIGLADNLPMLLAYGNDEGYENIFAHQLTNLIEAGDVVIAISGSGNSPNIIKAVEVAKQAGGITIAFTGFGGGKLGPLADINVCVPSSNMEQIEDIHLMIEHIICSTLREDAKQYKMSEDLYQQWG
jgi:D-sedoheptulose 7-phosphate isomerase